MAEENRLNRFSTSELVDAMTNRLAGYYHGLRSSIISETTNVGEEGQPRILRLSAFEPPLQHHGETPPTLESNLQRSPSHLCLLEQPRTITDHDSSHNSPIDDIPSELRFSIGSSLNIPDVMDSVFGVESHDHSEGTRTILKPMKETITNTAKMNLLTEVEYADSDCQNWIVGVDVIGTVRSHEEPSIITKVCLDVAIIIDNSICSSPAALIAHCDTAIYLTSLLHSTKDRLTVLITNPPDSSVSRNVIIPLKEVDLESLKAIVDQVKSSIDEPDTNPLKQSLAFAEHILTTSYNPHNRTEDSCDGVRGLIYILTPNTKAFSANETFANIIQTTVVSPGIIPWKSDDTGVVNGWRISPALADFDVKSSNSHHKCQQGLRECLHRSVCEARLNTSFAQIRDLTLKFKSRSCSTILRIDGDSNVRSLNPGEVVSLLIKVRVNPEGDLPTSLNTVPSATPTRSTNLIDEIEQMISTVSILDAKLKFRLSSFAPSTTVCLKGDARLKVSYQPTNRDLRKSLLAVDRLEPEENFMALGAEIQKRQILHIATRNNPGQALTTLATEFGREETPSLCPEYLKLISAELQYQAAMIQRYELSTEPNLGPSAANPSDLAIRGPSSPMTTSSHCRRQAGVRSETPAEWISDAHLGGSSPTDATTSTANPLLASMELAMAQQLSSSGGVENLPPLRMGRPRGRSGHAVYQSVRRELHYRREKGSGD